MPTVVRPGVVLSGLMLVIAGVLLGHFTLEAKAQKSRYPCTVQFIDRAGDKVTSDGGPYVDGQTGVSCEFNSANLVLNLSSKPGRPSPRTMYATFSDPVAGWPALGTLRAEFMTVLKVTRMEAGTVAATDAHFRLSNGTYSLNWCGTSGWQAGSPCATQDPSRESNAVVVQRRSAPNQAYWDVTTDLWAFGSNDSSVGDVASLFQYSTSTAIGWYHMPFQLLVYCPTCP
jgi:hypothetical protein